MIVTVNQRMTNTEVAAPSTTWFISYHENVTEDPDKRYRLYMNPTLKACELYSAWGQSFGDVNATVGHLFLGSGPRGLAIFLFSATIIICIKRLE